MKSENHQFDFQINYNQMWYQLVFIVRTNLRTNLRIGVPMRTVQTTQHFSFWSFLLGSVSFISCLLISSLLSSDLKIIYEVINHTRWGVSQVQFDIGWLWYIYETHLYFVVNVKLPYPQNIIHWKPAITHLWTHTNWVTKVPPWQHIL